jgi:hypothetical protein
MHKQTAKKQDSRGTLIAEKARERANGFSDAKRQALLEQGLAMIYGGSKHAKAAAYRS